MHYKRQYRSSKLRW